MSDPGVITPRLVYPSSVLTVSHSRSKTQKYTTCGGADTAWKQNTPSFCCPRFLKKKYLKLAMQKNMKLVREEY